MVQTAVAIDHFIALSVAHNFLPQSLGGQQNSLKSRASSVTFGLQYDSPSEGLTLSISRYILHPRWEQSFDPSFDIAVLLLNKPAKNDSTRFVRPYIQNHDLLLNKEIFVTGYPAAIPGVLKNLQGESMYVSDGKIIDCCGRQVHYDANTYAGNSGGPVVMGRKEDDRLIALHTRGNPAAMRNSGVQLRGDLETFIQTAIEDFYKPQTYEEELNELMTSYYQNIKLSDSQLEFIHSLQNKNQAEKFLNILVESQKKSKSQ